MKFSMTSLVSRLGALLFASVLTITLVATVTAQTRHLPLSYYTDRYGPAPSGAPAWLDGITSSVIFIDALGRRNIQFALGLPTTVSGGVTVTTLADGTERNTVDIDTENALCWGRTFDESLGFLPAFGYSPTEVAANRGPAALGSSRQHFVFAPQPAGQFDVFGILESIRTTVSCEGTLRSQSGFVEGSPGRAHTTQVGIFDTGVTQGCPPEGGGDCFPVERVQFTETGN